jgi:FkbM family methyltransferase
MWRSVKKAVNRSLRSLGYRVVPVQDPMAIQASLLKDRTVRTIFDVGANVGQTIGAYRRRFPEATIHAFEPHPGCFEALGARFAGDRQVRLIHTAVGDSEGTGRFLVSTHPTRHSLLAPVDGGVEEEIEVPVTTLDSYLARTGISHVDLLKVDVEGAEMSVFRGARDALANGRISVIFMEAMFIPHYEGQPLFHDLVSHLAHHGFQVFDLTGLKRAPGGQVRWGNVVLTRP